MESQQASALEDRRVEYASLRTEILQADNNCVLMMGYVVTAVGFLYSVQLEWLAGLVAFVGFCYFTEKRFVIRKIASFLKSEVCKEDSGFGWESHIQKLRQEKSLRPFTILRPYNAEIIICSLVAISPIFNGILSQLSVLEPHAIFWLIFAVLTVVLSVLNGLRYNQSSTHRSVK